MLKYVALSLLFITPALGHEWFEKECCNDVGHNDCHHIECSELTENQDGSVSYVTPGNKTTLTFKNTQYFTSIRPSQDSKCGVCYKEYGGTGASGYCVYIQSNM